MLGTALTLALAVAGTPATDAATTAAAKPAAPAVKLSADEAALHALDQSFASAMSKKDVAGIMAYYADDAVVMDPGPSLILRGKDEIRKSFTEFMAQPAALDLNIHDARYKVSGTMAYGYGLFTMKMTDPDGKVSLMEGRACSVFEKRAGKWVAVLDHASLPMAPPAAPTAAAAK